MPLSRETAKKNRDSEIKLNAKKKRAEANNWKVAVGSFLIFPISNCPGSGFGGPLAPVPAVALPLLLPVLKPPPQNHHQEHQKHHQDNHKWEGLETGRIRNE